MTDEEREVWDEQTRDELDDYEPKQVCGNCHWCRELILSGKKAVLDGSSQFGCICDDPDVIEEIDPEWTCECWEEGE